MAHVAKWKYQEVETLTQLISNNKIIGIAEIGGIPAPQMQQMRQNLRGKLHIQSSKNTLLYRAIDAAAEKVDGAQELKELVNGQTALITTDINPFRLYATLKETRTKAPAKGGEIASEDILVKAGDTPFKPGPIVGELQKVGIPAAIQSGKVVIKKDKVLVKAGEKIPRDIAQMLTRLEIFPVEIGIKLQGAFEEGFIFKPEILDIDMDQFRTNFQRAASNAFHLAVETAWSTNITIQPLIQKAHRDAFALALDAGVINKQTIKRLCEKAHRSMLSVASKIKDDGLDEDIKGMMS